MGLLVAGGEAGPVGSAEGGGELGGERADILEVAGASRVAGKQRLPPRLVGVGRAVGLSGGVGLVDHAREGGDSRMMVPAGVGQWRTEADESFGIGTGRRSGDAAVGWGARMAPWST